MDIHGKACPCEMLVIHNKAQWIYHAQHLVHKLPVNQHFKDSITINTALLYYTTQMLFLTLFLWLHDTGLYITGMASELLSNLQCFPSHVIMQAQISHALDKHSHIKKLNILNSTNKKVP